jgi:hypothetical protein
MTLRPREAVSKGRTASRAAVESLVVRVAGATVLAAHFWHGESAPIQPFVQSLDEWVGRKPYEIYSNCVITRDDG